MKTFFYILLTMTLLIGTTLFYVINDNSTIIEFTPETSTVSDSLKTPSPKVDPSKTNSGTTTNDNPNRSNGAGQPSPVNGSTDPVANSAPLAVQAPESTDSPDTISGPDEERIKEEIRILRGDTNQLLKKMTRNK